MIGALIGDIVGSRFEWHNYRAKDFELFHSKCEFTDDSVMSLALCSALLRCDGDWSDLSRQSVRQMQELGKQYPHRGYGDHFLRWIYAEDPRPYNSYGNGSAMRVGGCAWVANSLAEAKELSKAVTEVTHNHPEGIKGAEATAVAAFLARQGASKSEIRACIERDYYTLDFTLDEIRHTYEYDVSCQGSVPQALQAFLEASDFEDAIRNAISIGGDSDTIAAITGSVAEAYYGVPSGLREKAVAYLDAGLRNILDAFEEKYPPTAPLRK